MKRVTEYELQSVVNGLNLMTSNPVETYRRDEQGELIANVGNYHLDYAYGKVRLVQIDNSCGGIRTLTEYGTKRETYNAITAYYNGYIVGLTGK